MLEGSETSGAFLPAARVGHDANIAMGGAVLGKALRVIDPELQQRRQRNGEAVWTNHDDGNTGAVRGLDDDFIVDGVALMIVLGIEQNDQRTKCTIGVTRDVLP